jgi:hypothetical protein
MADANPAPRRAISRQLVRLNHGWFPNTSSILHANGRTTWVAPWRVTQALHYEKLSQKIWSKLLTACDAVLVCGSLTAGVPWPSLSFVLGWQCDYLRTDCNYCHCKLKSGPERRVTMNKSSSPNRPRCLTSVDPPLDVSDLHARPSSSGCASG